MKVMLRYGSAWHDVELQLGAITKLGLTQGGSSFAQMILTPKLYQRMDTWIASCVTPSVMDWNQ